MVQNVRPEDLAHRTMLLNMGLPCVSLDEANLIPVGLLNNTCFPSPLRNSLCVWDPKLEFNQYAVVLDHDRFYQWRIAESYSIENENRLWFQSKLFKLDKLYSINIALQEYRNSNQIKNPTPELIQAIENKYDELEVERNVIRNKILQYHIQNKPEGRLKNIKPTAVPRLSCFDSVRPSNSGYQVKTHTEPLLLRSAVRNANKAEEAETKNNGSETDHFALLDEIEYSAMCIISSVNCLETYINFVLSKYLPDALKISGSATSLRQKWLCALYALDPQPNFNRSHA